MIPAFRRHWPEYGMEAAETALFMVSACLFATLFFHPESPVFRLLPDPIARRALMGLAMGLTAIAIVYSPWGRQSGAHMNPAVTLTFLRVGKVKPADAAFYLAAQFIGAVAGVLAASLVIHDWIAHPSINYLVTLPGPGGLFAAFAAEAAISFGLMLLILIASNAPAIAPLTGVFVGGLVWVLVTIESPVSGCSMNPARTLGSAVWADVWQSLWIYMTAPVIGMLAAAEAYRRAPSFKGVLCAKLYHAGDKRCIFCGFKEQSAV